MVLGLSSKQSWFFPSSLSKKYAAASLADELRLHNFQKESSWQLHKEKFIFGCPEWYPSSFRCLLLPEKSYY